MIQMNPHYDFDLLMPTLKHKKMFSAFLIQIFNLIEQYFVK